MASILVVDDEPGVRSSVTGVLEDEGFEVDAVGTGEACLDRVAERAYDVIDVMGGIARAKGVSVAQIALAWLLHQPVVTSVIVGAKRIDQLEDNLAATAVRLTDDERTALETVSRLPAEYPGWMFERQGGARQAQLDALTR